MNNITTTNSSIAGFWQRLLALAVDSLIIFIIGYFSAKKFSDILVPLHSYGQLIGFAIGYLYFAIQNSSICNGQTIGKRIFKIQVVDSNGKNISFLKSSIRFFVLEFPLFINSFTFSTDNYYTISSLFILCAQASIFFGLSLAIAYLYIANKRTRQSVHDLVVSSYVRTLDQPWTAPSQKINPIHYKVIAIYFIALISILSFFSKQSYELSSTGSMKEMASIRNTLLRNSNFHQVQVKKSLNNSDKSHIAVAVEYDHKIELSDKIIEDIASEILASDHNLKDSDELTIVVFYSANIGISRHTEMQNETKPVKEWKEKIVDPKKVSKSEIQ